jgi:Leucine-rich repeat (LRR) protein
MQPLRKAKKALCIGVFWGIGILAVFAQTTLQAATYYYESGNPSVPGSWGTTSGAGLGTPAFNFSTPGDVFIIENGYTATLTGDLTIGTGVSLIIQAGGILNTQTNTVNGGGDVNLQSGGTLRTSHINGFNGGAVQVSGTRTWSTGANYIFAPPAGPDRDFNIATAQVNNLTTIAGGGTARVNANLQVDGTFTGDGRISICGPTLTLQGAGPHSLSQEIWIGSGNLTVNGTLNVTATGRLALIGTGGGCGSGNINGTGTITYAAGGTLAAGGDWMGTLDTPELPVSPTAMNGNINLDGAGGLVTVANNLRLIGDLTLSAVAGRHLVMAMGRTIILEGAGVINAPGAVSRIQVNNLNSVVMRRGGINGVHYVSNYIYNLRIDNALNVNLTNPLIVGEGGLEFINSGNLVVGPTTLTLQGGGGNHVFGGGAGRVDATNMSSVVELTGNPQINGAKFVQPITTLRTGTTPAAAPSLNAGTFAVVNLDHANGTLVLTVPMTLSAAGTHTIAAGPPARVLDVASFGRLVIPNGTLTNNGTLNIQSAGTLEIRDNASVAVNPPTYTAAASVLMYTGAVSKVVGSEWPATMTGRVVVDKTASGFLGVNSGLRTQNGILEIQSGNLDVQIAGTLTLGAAAHSVAGADALLRVFEGGAINGLNNLTVNSGGVFAVVRNGSPAPARAGTPTFAAGGILRYAGNTAIATASEFPNTMPGNVEVFNSATVNQQIGVSKTVNGSFSFGPTGVYTIGMGNTLTVNGTFTNTPMSDLRGGTGSLVLGGSVVNPIRMITSNNLTNLTLGAGSGNVPFGTPVNVSNTLTMSGGLLNMGPNFISVNNAAAGAITGGPFNNMRHIVGTLSRAVNAAGSYLFPVGKGGAYLPLSLNNAGVTTQVDVEAFNAAPPGGTAGTGITTPFHMQHWRMESTMLLGGSATVTLERAANFPASTVVGQSTMPTTASPFNGVGPAGFPGGTNTITSSAITPYAGTRFFTTGIGMAPEPTAKAQGLTFSGITSTDFIASFTGAMPAADRYLVVRRPIAAAPVAPTDGVAYTVGMAALGGVIIADLPHSGGTINVPTTYTTGLPAGSQWAIDIYSYNGTGATSNYLTEPVTGFVYLLSPVFCSSIPTTVDVSLLERVIRFTGVSLTGAGVISGAGTNTVFALPSGSVDISYSYSGIGSPPTYCPGCITQLYIGMNAGGTNVFRDCFSGNPHNASGMRTASFTVPAAPGTYYINVTGTWDFSCQPVGFSETFIPNNTIAMVIVGAPPCLNNSDILTPETVPTVPFTYNTAIPYVGFTGASVPAAAPDIWRFRIRDGGTVAPDPDGLPTVLTQVTLTLNDPRGVVSRIALYDATGTMNLGELPAAPMMSFTGLNIIAPDNGTVDVRVKAVYKTTPTMPPMDNATFSVGINNVTAGSGSGFLNPAAMLTSASSGVNVVADRLQFQVQPSNVISGTVMMPAPVVRGVDINGNLDADFTGTVTLNNPNISSGNVVAAAGGVATFPALICGTPAMAQTINATSPPLLPMLSLPFNITASQNSDFQEVAPPPVNLSYVAFTGAIAAGHPTVWRVRVRDGGAAMTDVDNLPTTLTSVSIQVNDPNGALNEIALYDAAGTMQLVGGAPQTASGTVTFAGLNVVAPDNGTIEFTVKARFRTTPGSGLMDGAPFSFAITGAATSPLGSGFATPALAASPNGTVNVIATRLNFATMPPASFPVGVTIPLQKVLAEDINGNVDTSYTGTVTLSNANLASSGVTTATAGLALYPSLVFGSPAMAQSLSATSMPALALANSSLFTIVPGVITITPTLVPTNTLDFGRVPVGRTADIAYNVSGTNIPPSGITLSSNSPNFTLSNVGAGPLFVTQATIVLTPMMFTVNPTPIFVRFTPTTLNQTTVATVLHAAAGVTLALTGIGTGISPLPIALGMDISSSTATGSLLRASEVPQVLQIGTYRSDGVLAPVPEATQVRFSIAPFGMSTANLVVVAGTTATISTGATTSPGWTVRVDWLNAPPLGGETNALVTVATISGHVMNSTTAVIKISAERTLPRIAAIIPDYQGAGGTVRIVGSTFASVTAVSFGGQRYTPTIMSSTEMLVTLDSAARSGMVIVENPAGADTLKIPNSNSPDVQAFEFAPPPVIRNFFRNDSTGADPFQRFQASGRRVLLRGSHLAPRWKTFDPSRFSLTFGGVPAQMGSLNGIDSANFAGTVANGASGIIRLTTPGGTATTGTFTFVPPPRITAFAPRFGRVGTEIIVTGANFIAMDTNGVRIGTTRLNNVQFLSDSTLVATVGTRTSGPVVVTNIAGTTVSMANFTYVDPPVITDITPSTTAVGRTITITGRNFIQVSSIRLANVTVASYFVNSSTSIVALIPSRATTANLTLTTPGGTTTSTQVVEVVQPPVITSFAPAAVGAGNFVTVTGANFRQDSTFVAFAGLVADSVIVSTTGTMLRARVPPFGGASIGNLIVGNLAGQTTIARQISLVPPPAIQEFVPFEGTTGNTVTITGVAFVNVTNVTVGGTTVASFTVDSPSRMTIVLGEGAPGPIRIYTEQGIASSPPFRFLYKDTLPPPVITRFTPTMGGPGTRVTITGVNFNRTNRVLFGGMATNQFVVTSPRELVATVPDNATTGSVTVITPFGTTTSTVSFVFEAPDFLERLSPLQRDSIGLARLFASTNGSSWREAFGWTRTLDSGLATPVAQWRGVRVEPVNGVPRVTQLELPNSNLNGFLPNFLGLLTELRVLNLRGNMIAGAITSSVATLTNLQVLDMSDNQLTDIDRLLANLPMFRALRVLRLDNNQFAVNSPTASSLLSSLCGRLPSGLTELSLSGNQLAGTLPLCLAQATTLRRLDLSNNRLEGAIPPEFGQLSSLQELVLANNRLTGNIPSSFANPTTAMAQAKPEQGSIAALVGLQRLDLSNNLLSGEIPSGIWTLTSLRHLNLSGNALSGQIPSAIGRLRSLQTLALRSMRLTGLLPRELGTLSLLEELLLDSNRLEGALPAGLTDIASLRVVDGTANRLTSVPSFSERVQRLLLAGNRLTFESLEGQGIDRAEQVGRIITYIPQDSVGRRLDTAGISTLPFRLLLNVGGALNVYQWFKNGAPLASQRSSQLDITAFSIADTGTYTCRIVNSRVPGLELWSRPVSVSFRLPSPPTQAPVLVAPVTGASDVTTSPLLVWRRVAQATGYEVQLTDSAAFPLASSSLLRAADTALRVTNLTGLRAYRWRVRAFNEGGAGAWSTEATFTTLPSGAVLAAASVNFGRVLVGTAQRRTIRLTNVSNDPVTLESLALEESGVQTAQGAAAQTFRLLTTVRSVTIRGGESISIEAEFVPSRQIVGARTAALMVTFRAQGSSVLLNSRQPSVLQGNAGALRVEGADLGVLAAERKRLSTVLLINEAAFALQVSNVAVRNTAGSAFALEGQFRSLTLAPNDTVAVPISCEPPSAGTFEAALQVNATNDVFAAPLRAAARTITPRDVEMTVAVRPRSSLVLPGEEAWLDFVVVPPASAATSALVQEHLETIVRALNSTIFRTEVRFDRNVLALDPEPNAATTAYEAPISSGQRITQAIVTGRWSTNRPLSSVLGSLRCRAVLGDVDFTRLEMPVFTWQGQLASGGASDVLLVVNISTGATVSTAVFQTDSTKPETKRLLRSSLPATLSKAVPNPVSDETTLTYAVRSQGEVLLELFDVQGRKVQEVFRRSHAPGEYAYTLRVRELPSGTYTAVLTTTSERLSERIEVVK